MKISDLIVLILCMGILVPVVGLVWLLFLDVLRTRGKF